MISVFKNLQADYPLLNQLAYNHATPCQEKPKYCVLQSFLGKQLPCQENGNVDNSH